MPVEIRTTRPIEDAALLAANLRPSDLAEVRVCIGDLGDIAQTIRRCIFASPDCASVWADDELLFVIGCADAGDHLTGQPWLLATPAVRHYPKAMTKITKQSIVRWRQRWEFLANWIDARQDRSIRWLESLGFALGEPMPRGAYGGVFRLFTMGV